MCGEAYAQSRADRREAWARSRATRKNAEPMLGVIRKHRKAAYQMPADGRERRRCFAAQQAAWDEALALGERARLPQQPGHRARAHRHHRLHDGLRHHRHRAGHRAHQVQEAGRRRHAEDRQQHGPAGAAASSATAPPRSQAIVSYLDKNDTIEGAPGLKAEHLPVFDCAFKPAKGERTIHYMGHLKMMGAAQPFLSGAISQDGQPAQRRRR